MIYRGKMVIYREIFHMIETTLVIYAGFTHWKMVISIEHGHLE